VGSTNSGVNKQWDRRRVGSAKSGIGEEIEHHVSVDTIVGDVHPRVGCGARG
jgi:hypothetical protein